MRFSRLGAGVAIGALTLKAYDLLVRGALTLDVGIGRRVARSWHSAVEQSITAVKAEAERRTRAR